MEVNDPYLTLLTSDGEFLRARKMDRIYSIGEEIDFFPVTDYLQSKKTKSFKNFFTLKTVWMTMAILMICLGSIIPGYQSNKAYAYMSIDAGTSMELGLNKDMQVVELKGFNNEAEKIISELDGWKKMDASELTSIILTELKEEGHITQAEPVVISMVKTDELKGNGTAKLQENIEQIKQKVDINLLKVSMYTSTEEEVEKAQDSGIPVGVYHRNKNNAAQKKQTKEKDKQTKMEIVKPTDSSPSESPSTTALPPGQQNKLDKVNKNANSNQQVDQNQDIQTSNPIPTEQGNGEQTPPGLNKDGTDKGNGNQANLGMNNKQEKPKTNNQNKPAKQEKNSKK
ncbi:anti-sigma factor domain-containing protein [Neobacillus sp. 3P2-tot-E-2]|uniref:anti-sigma factor domain-containing protein n=1 Tax=Neobacillus sp. 3P2-tot-E-2 TaxID=3132212 RepID=UPI00399F4A75